jgi:hypothetical protein
MVTGGSHFKWHTRVGNGPVGWRCTSGVEKGTRHSSGRPARGLRPMGVGGGGFGAPLRREPARIGESGADGWALL